MNLARLALSCQLGRTPAMGESAARFARFLGGLLVISLSVWIFEGARRRALVQWRSADGMSRASRSAIVIEGALTMVGVLFLVGVGISGLLAGYRYFFS